MGHDCQRKKGSMPTQAEIDARIAAIDSILEAGMSSTSIDGLSTTYDFEALRKERKALYDQSTAAKADGRRRVRMRSFRF